MRKAPLLLAAGLIVALSLPASAGAYCRTTTCRTTAEKECAKDENDCVTEGTPLVWPSRCIGFSFQAQGTAKLVPEDTKQAILGAFATWSEHPCPDGSTASISISATTDVQCKLPQANKEGANVNVVFFRDDEWPYRGIDGTLATTTVTYDGDGTIWDADIAVNAAFNDVTLSDTDAEYDVQSIVVHEVGHFLGLAHSDDEDALMAPTYSPGSVRRDVADDDIEALCAAYPAGRSATCSIEPRGGFGPRCSETAAEDPAEEGGCTASPRSPGGSSAGLAAALTSAMLVVLAALRRCGSHRKPSRTSRSGQS